MGTALIKAAVELASELGIGRLGLDVYAFNTEAMSFYKNRGFQVVRHVMSLETGKLLSDPNLPAGL